MEKEINPTLVVLFDALSYNYMIKSPLKELTYENKVMHVLESVLGYQYGEMSFLTGESIEELGIWFNFVYRKKGVYSNWLFNKAIQLIEKMRLKSFLKASLLTYSLFGIKSKGISNLHKIPSNMRLDFLKYLDVCLDEAICYNNHEKNVFSLLSREGGKFSYILSNVEYDEKGYKLHYFKKANDASTYDIFKSSLSYDKKFYMVHYIDFDKMAHLDPSIDNENTKKQLEKTSGFVLKTVDAFLKKFPCGKFIIFGDHGMSKVENYLDVDCILENINCLYFTDSVCLRLYGKVDEKLIKKNIKKKGYEKFIEIVKPKIKEVGDLIILAKKGCVFYPDFFNKDKVKGMHGYKIKDKEGSGCVISNIGENREEISILEFYSLMLDCIGIRK